MKQQLFFYLLAIASLSFFFTSCEKNDPQDEASDLEIRATVEQGGSYNATLATVKAMIYLEEDSDSDGEPDWTVYEVTSGKYENGGFKITLPATIPGRYLRESDDDLKQLLSDAKAGIAPIQLFAYDRQGNETGEFYLSDDNLGVECYYLYSDRSLIIKGTDSEGNKYDCMFNKGWNQYYSGYSDDDESWYSTTAQPQSANFRWRYYKY